MDAKSFFGPMAAAAVVGLLVGVVVGRRDRSTAWKVPLSIFFASLALMKLASRVLSDPEGEFTMAGVCAMSALLGIGMIGLAMGARRAGTLSRLEVAERREVEASARRDPAATGECPSCRAELPLSAGACPQCDAVFGVEGGWKVLSK